MDELARWLGEILDAEAEQARAAADGDSGEWFVGDKWNVYRVEDETPRDEVETNALVCWGNVKDQSEHIAEHDPARVLRDIEAKRDLLRLAERAHDYPETFMNGFASALEGTLRLFAAAYADQPGYLEEWRP